MSNSIRKKKIAPLWSYWNRHNICPRLNSEPESDVVRRVAAFADALTALQKGCDWSATRGHLDGIGKLLGDKTYVEKVSLSGNGIHVHKELMRGKPFSPDEEWEYAAVSCLLESVKDGREALRLRRCSVCAKWLYAVRADQVFCGSACRQRRYDTEPERRREKLEYMRKRYAQQKERDAKAKASIGFAGGALRSRRAESSGR